MVLPNLFFTNKHMSKMCEKNLRDSFPSQDIMSKSLYKFELLIKNKWEKIWPDLSKQIFLPPISKKHVFVAILLIAFFIFIHIVTMGFTKTLLLKKFLPKILKFFFDFSNNKNR